MAIPYLIHRLSLWLNQQFALLLVCAANGRNGVPISNEDFIWY